MSFERLNSLLQAVDNVFHDMAAKYENEICCKPGCDDCCHACFDISLIEEEYLKFGFSKLNDEQKEKIFSQAEAAADKIGQLTKSVKDDPTKKLKEEISVWRVRCPLLAENNQCTLYDYRPVTCRAYGLPTSINNRGHVCGFSKFDKGQVYPTVKLDQIYHYLLELSSEVANKKKMAESKAQERRYICHVLKELR